MSMKISCNYKDRKASSYATVWTSLWRHPDASQYLVDWVEDVRTSDQHRQGARSRFSNFYTELDLRSRHCLERFCKTSGRRGNMSERCPAFQNISVFCSNAEKSYSEDLPDAQPSRFRRIPVKERFTLFWKAVAEDRPDEANFRPDARQPESQFV
jgi:hypothetical protein